MQTVKSPPCCNSATSQAVDICRPAPNAGFAVARRQQIGAMSAANADVTFKKQPKNRRLWLWHGDCYSAVSDRGSLGQLRECWQYCNVNFREKSMKQSMTALIVALFAMGSASVFAQPGAQPGQEQEQLGQEQQAQAPGQEQQEQMKIQGKEFSELDSDQDGMVTETEAQEAGIEPVTFDAIDANANELIEEAEFEQAKEGGAAR
jgi:hypothetical protein